MSQRSHRPSQPTPKPHLSQRSAGGFLSEHKDSLCWDLCRRIHDGIPASLEMAYVHSLRSALVLMQGRPFVRWSLFAGSGMASKWSECIGDFLSDRYELDIHMVYKAYAEHNSWKQQFIKLQQYCAQSARALCEKSRDLASGATKDLVTGNPRHLLTHLDQLDSGVHCVSRSNYNMNAA